MQHNKTYYVLHCCLDFYHPDYTVGIGISPIQSLKKTESRGL